MWHIIIIIIIFIIIIIIILKQRVSFYTHIHGQWLDFLITRSTTDYIHTRSATDGLSDHFTVIAEI